MSEEIFRAGLLYSSWWEAVTAPTEWSAMAAKGSTFMANGPYHEYKKRLFFKLFPLTEESNSMGTEKLVTIPSREVQGQYWDKLIGIVRKDLAPGMVTFDGYYTDDQQRVVSVLNLFVDNNGFEGMDEDDVARLIFNDQKGWTFGTQDCPEDKEPACNKYIGNNQKKVFSLSSYDKLYEVLNNSEDHPVKTMQEALTNGVIMQAGTGFILDKPLLPEVLSRISNPHVTARGCAYFIWKFMRSLWLTSCEHDFAKNGSLSQETVHRAVEEGIEYILSEFKEQLDVGTTKEPFATVPYLVECIRDAVRRDDSCMRQGVVIPCVQMTWSIVYSILHSTCPEDVMSRMLVTTIDSDFWDTDTTATVLGWLCAFKFGSKTIEESLGPDNIRRIANVDFSDDTLERNANTTYEKIMKFTDSEIDNQDYWSVVSICHQDILDLRAGTLKPTFQPRRSWRNDVSKLMHRIPDILALTK